MSAHSEPLSLYETKEVNVEPHHVGEEFDPIEYYESNAGRLVMDPREAQVEFGEDVASKLKLSQDGTKVLWPQPLDDPEDPQNWSAFRKGLQLFIITLATIVPDFEGGIGIATIFPLSVQFNTTTGVINDLTSNWSIFLIGWGGLFAVMLMHRYGRLPVLFWTQFISFGFLIGCTFAPNLSTFAAMRCLNGFFATAPQVTGLYVVTDMFPFHLQARKLDVWTMGFIASPFISPFLFGFFIDRVDWRWAYGIGCFYEIIVLILIAVWGEETLYDRALFSAQKVPRSSIGLRYRFETLVGITGARMAKYRSSWRDVSVVWFKLIWRPHLLAALLFEAMVFGFAVGLFLTNVILLRTPLPVGYGLSDVATAACYATPLVAILIGEVSSHFLNDWIMNLYIRRHNGVFEAESRFWACYIGVPVYVVGFVLIGVSLQHHLNIGVFIIGWGLAETATMVNTVAVYAYLNDCFPRLQGEISALLNLARTLGGFSVTYYQVPWVTKNGAVQAFGVEAAIVAGLFLLIIPTLQLTGNRLRSRFAF